MPGPPSADGCGSSARSRGKYFDDFVAGEQRQFLRGTIVVQDAHAMFLIEHAADFRGRNTGFF